MFGDTNEFTKGLQQLAKVDGLLGEEKVAEQWMAWCVRGHHGVDTPL